VAIENGTWSRDVADELAEESLVFETYARRHIEIQTNASGKLLRNTTKEHYYTLLRNRLAFFASMDIRHIDKPLVDEWFARISKDGKLTTASKSYKLLSTVMERAVRDKVRVDNPCEIKGAQSLTTGKRVTYPTTAELELLIEAITPRYKVLLLLAGVAGLRFGEVSELRVSDLERITVSGVSSYIVNVKRAVTYSNGVFVVGDPKSAAGKRPVNVSSGLTSLLDELLAKRQVDGIDALLFPSASGGHLRNDVLATALKRAKVKANLADSGFTPHSLRHYGGTQFSGAGATLADVQAWLGDVSEKAALRYLHPLDQARDIAERMPVPKL
jgi:integrase